MEQCAKIVFATHEIFQKYLLQYFISFQFCYSYIDYRPICAIMYVAIVFLLFLQGKLELTCNVNKYNIGQIACDLHRLKLNAVKTERIRFGSRSALRNPSVDWSLKVGSVVVQPFDVV